MGTMHDSLVAEEIKDNTVTEQKIDARYILLTEILADDEFNCRGKIAPIDVKGLADDIRDNGLIQPVVVAPYSQDGYNFKLVAGFRRFRAHELILKAEKIACIVKEEMQDETKAFLFNLAENIQREDLNIIQEGKAVVILMQRGMNRTTIARALNQSPGWVQIRQTLMKLPEDIQDEAKVGIITQPQIRELFTIFHKDGSEEMYRSVRRLKDAKGRADKKVAVRIGKVKAADKRHRKRGEIQDLNNYFMDKVDPGLYSRCFAWCAGNITYQELFESFKEEYPEIQISIEEFSSLGDTDNDYSSEAS